MMADNKEQSLKAGVDPNRTNEKKDKAHYNANQAKMLKTYEREGSDYLEKQSEQRRSTVRQHDFQPIQREGDINKFKIYRPKIQLIADYILMVPMLIILLVRIGVVKLSDDAEKNFSDYVAPKVSGILVMYVFKPFIATFFAKCLGYTNQSFYARKVYAIRCTYDAFFIFFPTFMTFEDLHLTVIQTVVIVCPVIFLELILYYCSVKSGKEHSKKIIYRLLKIKINTCEENDAMFSTDDEGECTDRSISFAESQNRGGPYNINPNKIYKPVFIVFLDMMVSITFIMVSLMYFWVQIKNDEQVDMNKFSAYAKYFTYIPTNVTFLWVVLVGKNLGNAIYLAKKYGIDKANGSKVTSHLFWFRVFYDLIVIAGSLILFSVLKKTNFQSKIGHEMMKDINKEISNTVQEDVQTLGMSSPKLSPFLMGNTFVVYVVIIPITFLEVCIFWFCKVEAEQRTIYQEFAKEEWPKGSPNPSQQRRNTLETFESIQKHFMKLQQQDASPSGKRLTQRESVAYKKKLTGLKSSQTPRKGNTSIDFGQNNSTLGEEDKKNN